VESVRSRIVVDRDIAGQPVPFRAPRQLPEKQQIVAGLIQRPRSPAARRFPSFSPAARKYVEQHALSGPEFSSAIVTGLNQFENLVFTNALERLDDAHPRLLLRQYPVAVGFGSLDLPHEHSR
jgi:hypothetical protein